MGSSILKGRCKRVMVFIPNRLGENFFRASARLDATTYGGWNLLSVDGDGPDYRAVAKRSV